MTKVIQIIFANLLLLIPASLLILFWVTQYFSATVTDVAELSEIRMGIPLQYVTIDASEYTGELPAEFGPFNHPAGCEECKNDLDKTLMGISVAILLIPLNIIFFYIQKLSRRLSHEVKHAKSVAMDSFKNNKT